MKKFVFAFLAASTASHAMAQSNIVFRKDLRPVDGALTELVIAESGAGYDITLGQAFYSRPQRKMIETSESIARGLECEISEERVFCSRDDRPSDGTLVEITVMQSGNDRYTASKRTVFNDRRTGQEVEQTDVIANGLQLFSK